jgi:hypothetical protein
MFDEIDFNNENNQPKNTDDLKVIYIERVGKDIDGKKIFHFLCGKDIENVWAEEWGEKPACNCKYLQPDERFYETVLELKSDIDFILGQENCCCSFQDVCDGCVAMAYENIDGYNEYPPLRIIIRYGETLDNVEEQLAKRDLTLHFISY